MAKGELQMDTDRRMQQAVRVAQEFEARQRLMDADANEDMAGLRAQALEELRETKAREQLTSRQLEESKRELELMRNHLERKEEDLNFCLEQLREVKMWAEQEIESLRGHAEQEVKQLKEELARCLQNAERERSRLLEELDERSRRLADTETLLLNERDRCESLAKATSDLSSRLEVDLEAKLALLTDEVSKISSGAAASGELQSQQAAEQRRPSSTRPTQPDAAEQRRSLSRSEQPDVAEQRRQSSTRPTQPDAAEQRRSLSRSEQPDAAEQRRPTRADAAEQRSSLSSAAPLPQTAVPKQAARGKAAGATAFPWQS